MCVQTVSLNNSHIKTTELVNSIHSTQFLYELKISEKYNQRSCTEGKRLELNNLEQIYKQVQ